jgi:hypothetical protein
VASFITTACDTVAVFRPGVSVVHALTGNKEADTNIFIPSRRPNFGPLPFFFLKRKTTKSFKINLYLISNSMFQINIISKKAQH